MYWFCSLDSFSPSTPISPLLLLLPAPSLSLSAFLPCSFCLHRLWFVLNFMLPQVVCELGFGSILSCLFVGVRCVCVCVVLLLPVGCLQCVLIDVASSLAASCSSRSWQPSCTYSFATPTPLVLPPPPHPALLTINLNAPLCIVKSSLCCCRLNRNVKP